mmetsp:Transcript_51938/g.153241  ORF Transcript_51938/g.153241 Transcript_51938/m.153241 type:complete len:231 (-) Transcript_51938:950-1642(-)
MHADRLRLLRVGRHAERGRVLAQLRHKVGGRALVLERHQLARVRAHLANIKLAQVLEGLARRVVELKEDGAVLVARLLRDDGRAARVLGEPRLDVEDHPVHRDPATAGVVVPHNVGPPVEPNPRLEIAQPLRAPLVQLATAEAACGTVEVLQRVDVKRERVGGAARGGLQEEEDAVKGGAVDLHLDRRRLDLAVAHRLRERDARACEQQAQREAPGITARLSSSARQLKG